MSSIGNENQIVDKGLHEPFLDGLRGLSILMVVFIHLSLFVVTDARPTYMFPEMADYFWAGTYGVQLFFTLSAHTLFRSYQLRSGVEAHPTRNFYLRRAFRILPLWFLWIFIYGNWGAQSHGLNSVLATAFFYMVFLRGTLPEVWPGAWSIYVEEFFYLFFPVWFRHINSVSKALVWMFMGLAIGYLWEKVAYFLGFPTKENFIQLFPLNQLFPFFIGIFVFHLDRSRVLIHLKSLPIPLVLLFDFIAMILLKYCLVQGHRFAAAALGIVFILSFNERSLFGRLTRLPILRRFGVCCFSIYLSHWFILPFMIPIFNLANTWGLPNSIEIRTVFWMPFFSFLVLGLGYISYRFFEVPCVQLGRRIIALRESSRHADLRDSVQRRSA